MTALSIQPPFPIITDIDGQPLEDGYIWIGVANLPPIGNPIAVYWDAALTQPAALPVRTRGGYPVNAGTPARLYVNSDYSIQVQNKNGSVLYSAPQATERYGALIISSADISFLQAGLGAVVRTAQSKMRDVVSVLDFGAVGDGVTDDSAAIQAAIDYASANGLGVDLAGRSYSVGSVRIKNGLRFLQNGKIVARTLGVKVFEFDSVSLGGANVRNCRISNVEMVLDIGPSYAIWAENCSYCTFENNYLHNTTNTVNTIFGISLSTSSHNKIVNNTVVLNFRHTGGQPIELYSPGVDAYWGYFANATGNITATANPCQFNVIQGNRTYGGLQGIAVQGANYNTITGNNIEAARDRGIIAVASVRNTISGNTVFNCGSSGIHLAYGCTQNVIEGNSITNLDASGGEAGLQAYVGCGGNTFVGNTVATNANYGVYIGVSSNLNVVSSNRVQNFAICGICVQSDWFGSGGQGVYGRPNYGAPPTGNRWAFTDTIGNSIKSNFIGDAANTVADCGISLIQVISADGVTNFKVTATDVTDNKIQSSSLTHNVYVFQNINAGVENCNLIGNSFSDASLSKVTGNQFAYTPDGYSASFAVISGNSGINSRQSWTPVVSGTTVAGTATYSVQAGTYTRIDKDTVHINLQLTWTGHTGTGGMSISLPTEPQIPAAGGITQISSNILMENIALTNTKWPVAILGTNNSNTILYEYQSGGGVAFVNMSAAGTVHLTGTYSYRVTV